ncbi:MAG: excinuclease ABC subunit UvrB, partial [bacterium]
KLHSNFAPKGDQPDSIKQLVESVKSGNKFTTLLGVTGSGKTYTMANVIEQCQKPVLVIAHNKTLAAQLCNEYKTFFPESAVEYFVSYYDYYQPEAYLPFSDLYIEKDASINREIDRLRHAATQSLLLRRDVIVVASVSCIYGIGSPVDYERACLRLEVGMEQDRDSLLRRFVEMQYQRTEDDLVSGAFRVRGGTIEIIPADRESILKLDFFGDDLERISHIHPETGEVIDRPLKVLIFPATHYVLPPERLEDALLAIEKELNERYNELITEGKEFEANRLLTRTRFDLEMIREIGYCGGIENYSRHFDCRSSGEPPSTLLNFFPDDFLVIIDESHVTIPQLRAMCHGDRSRKKNLVDYGFRLPCAYDNRPLTFEEFLEHAPQIVFTSATPGEFELKNSARIAEQIIRPTGLIDPEVMVRPCRGQIPYLLKEIGKVTSRGEKVLITTLTKKMAEDLTDYLIENNVRARYMHSDIDTLDRIQIIYGLRSGEFDVLVGINLLREGLDIPEVSLVAILDADKEGFLRSDVTLVQTMGRAARNINGKAILFGDRMTDSMRRAIEETNRRRSKQLQHNRKYKITPETIRKEVKDHFEGVAYRVSDRRAKYIAQKAEKIPIPSLPLFIAELEEKMWKAADGLDFETAAALRDQVAALKKKLEKEQKVINI